MSSSSDSQSVPLLEFKGGSFTLTVIRLGGWDRMALEKALDEKLAQLPGFFATMPMVLDVSAVVDEGVHEEPAQDLAGFKQQLLTVLDLIKERGLHVAALAGVEPELALSLGWALVRLPRPRAGSVASQDPMKSVGSSPSSAGAGSESAEDKRMMATSPIGPMVVKRPVRGGQQLYARGRDLVVLASVNADAELIADGSIHVYGRLRGKAIAGASGDTSARVFSTAFDPQLVAIGGVFKVFDGLAEQLRGESVQVFLDGERLLVEAI